MSAVTNVNNSIYTEKMIALPAYTPMTQSVESICYPIKGGTQWYPPVMVSASAIAAKFQNNKYIKDALSIMLLLDSDDYCNYLIEYYQEGIRRFADSWCYADIVTVLMALSDTLNPKSYLEIGVRRGRSVCAVASNKRDCDLYMFDMWVQNYAGMANPGPSHVSTELDKVAHSGKRIFINGNSHVTLKEFFNSNTDLAFDLITVDGDHSYSGAIEDLCDVLPHLKIGGAIVFDDICHPKHMYLRNVWRALIENDPRYSSWSCADIGYGVGFAIRKW